VWEAVSGLCTLASKALMLLPTSHVNNSLGAKINMLYKARHPPGTLINNSEIRADIF